MRQSKLFSYLFLIVLAALSVVFIMGCSPADAKADAGEPMMPPDTSDYQELWKQVDEFNSKGLPQSALKVVEQIYAAAKKNKDAGDFIKALIHKMRFLQEVEEETLVKVQKELDDELKTSEFPITPVLHSMLAEQYWNYYQANRWRILNRTTTSADFKQEDIRTWDARKIVETVVLYYGKSLENADKSKKIAIDVFDEILYKGTHSRRYRPTLYDFLAHRAIDFYMNSEAGLTQPKYQFTLNNKDYFLTAGEFSKLELTSKDTLSFQFYALRYLQDLIKFHLDDQDPEALVDVDLKRLHFVYQNAVISNKDIIYEEVLRQMLDKYKKNPVAAEIYYELALLYDRLGNQYNPGISDDYQWHKKKAHELCREAINAYPGSIGAINCQALIHQIEARFLQLTLEKVTVKNEPPRGLVNYRNMDKVYLKIVKTNRDEIQEKERLRHQDKVAYFINKEAVKQWEVALPEDKDYQTHAAEIKIQNLDWGMYMVLAANTRDFDYKNNVVAYTVFVISNIAYINRTRSDKGLEFYLVDRDTGQPLGNATAQVWERTYNNQARRYVETKGKTFTADRNGYFNISFGAQKNNYFYLEFINGNGEDRLFVDRNFSLYQPYDPYRKQTRTTFFTDRAIYRPGQTVYFKGIMLDVDPRDSENTHILKNYRTQVTLYDVNRQKVSQLDLQTNEFGTFSGTFQLPVGRLNGNMSIADPYGSVYFSMEEYKRPKFKVTFKSLEKTYRLEDVVTVEGEAKAYAGYNIDNAEVKYRVVRNVYYPYPWYFYRYGGWIPPSQPMEITSGETVTDADGVFKVTFEAIPDLTLSKDTKPAFCFTVYADVTDINGETQSSQKLVYIGYTALKLSLNLPEQLDKEQKETKVTINSTNLSGDFVKAEGDITIYKLKAPNRVLRERLWPKSDKFTINEKEYHDLFPYDVYKDEDNITKWGKEKQVFFTKFDTGELKEFKLSGLQQWKTGRYLAEMQSKDRFGNEIKEIKYFTLFSEKGNQAPYQLLDWFTVPKGTAEPGETAVILIGSSDKNVRVIYEVEHRDRIVNTQYLTLDNEQKRITIPIHEEHRGNVGVHFTFIKHNRLLTHSVNIQVPWSNKNLDISFATFRNKLYPGEKEEWRIKIRGPKGDRVAAEMVASLYDASLDAFRVNSWSFSAFPYHYLRYGWTTNPYFSTITTGYIGKLQEYSSTVSKSYDQLNWFGFYWWEGGYRYKLKRAAPAGAVAPAEAARETKAVRVGGRVEKVADEATLSEEVEAAPAAPGKKKNGGEEPPEKKTVAKEAPVQIRKNFNETAFFYPHLHTTPEGDVVIAFTIPEALTRWKMMGFAHTKELEYGFVYNELVTQKDLMVVPSTPRFFREGDTLVYTSKITNLSAEELAGIARLQLFDAVTMQPVDALFKHNDPEKSFTAKKGQSALVSWTLQIPEDLDAVTYRLTAKSGRFSDGEEQAVPILKNRMLVTESLPLPVRAKQTKSFTFKKLTEAAASKTLKHHRLTLEFTSNPVWYAVQALPYLMEYPHECLEQVFSRYYANSMAAYIVNANPKIKKVFDIWKTAAKDSPNANALLSNLEKNQELKTVLLEETPWVLNGQDETQRKQRVALLFDLNNMASQLDRALKKLKEGQMASGAWPWFRGMYESRYITQHIVCGFAHLDKLNVIDARKNNDTWEMLKKAIPYTDKEITEDYQRLLKNDIDLKQNNLGYIQVHYLYARSYFQDIPMDKRDITAFEYYKGQVKEYWVDFSKSKYMQGMMALIMKRYKDIETAVAIGESIKEHALYSEEMGMYWKTSYGYYWYQAPIETHALLIEVFAEVLNDQKSVDELKTWLLKQKQTQDWQTTKATVEACYALLLRGEDWLAESQPPEITLGKDHPLTIVPGKSGMDGERINAEAGTGYFKTSWPGKEVVPDMGFVQVKNNNNIVAWGSLYWQYFENLDKITPAETPLSLKKKLFIEKPSDTGPVIHPVDGKTKLKIGDRIKVRIELRVDRDMEYVHMKDMRASCLEPEDVISGYRWQDGLGYYQSTKDASTNFFMDYLSKGTYVFEYGLRVTHEGDFSNGITSIQCMYAPEFTSHSEGVRVSVSSK
jgi:uncharacterized protein YfaS (alpha-2-macroglobulin family)